MTDAAAPKNRTFKELEERLVSLDEAGDYNGYWALLEIEGGSDYAGFAGKVARNEGWAPRFGQLNLQEYARKRPSGQPFTEAELDAYRRAIVSADLAMRQEKHARGENALLTTTDEAVAYHLPVNKEFGLPPQAFTPYGMQRNGNRFWGLIAGTDDVDETGEVLSAIGDAAGGLTESMLEGVFGTPAFGDLPKFGPGPAEGIWEATEHTGEALMGVLGLDRLADDVRGLLDLEDEPPSGPEAETDAAPDRRSEAGGSGAAAATPEALAALRAAVLAAPDPVDTVLEKPVDRWTDAELSGAMRHDAYWDGADDRRPMLQDRVMKHHLHVWGTDPIQRDAAGRPIRSTEPKNKPQTNAVPSRTATGAPLDDAMAAVAAGLTARAKRTGVAGAVTALQRGLNALTHAADPPATARKSPKPKPVSFDPPGLTVQASDPLGRGRAALAAVAQADNEAHRTFGPALKEDGVFGPKTRRRTRQALTRFAPDDGGRSKRRYTTGSLFTADPLAPMG